MAALRVLCWALIFYNADIVKNCGRTRFLYFLKLAKIVNLGYKTMHLNRHSFKQSESSNLTKIILIM